MKNHKFMALLAIAASLILAGCVTERSPAKSSSSTTTSSAQESSNSQESSALSEESSEPGEETSDPAELSSDPEEESSDPAELSSESEETSHATGFGIKLTVSVDVPDFWEITSIYDGGAVVFAYLYGGDYDIEADEHVWLPTNKNDDGDVEFTLEIGKKPSHFIIVRCAAGTTEGNWDAKWNQTPDIPYVDGTTSYTTNLQ